MRHLCAMILISEAIVIGLAIPVAITVGNADAKLAGIAGGVLAVLAVLMAGLIRRPGGVAMATGFQVLVLATGFIVPTMFFLGALFLGLWGYAIWLGRNVEGTRAG
ncbi:MAG: DUF4233 domain-containing protein [Streptosporangiaceae bacterium]